MLDKYLNRTVKANVPIIIASSDENERNSLKEILQEFFSVILVENCNRLKVEFEANRSSVALIFVSTKLDGNVLKTVEEMNFTRTFAPIILICNEEEEYKKIVDAYEIGISDYISPPFRSAIVIKRAICVLRAANLTSYATVSTPRIKTNCVGQYKFGIDTLDMQCERAEFLDNQFHEASFEYYWDYKVLHIAKLLAYKLGTNEFIVEPENDEALSDALGADDLKALIVKICAASPSAPTVCHDCKVDVKGEMRFCRINLFVVFTELGERKGFVGKMCDIHKIMTQLVNLQHAAEHDSLTGLCNHKTARERINARIQKNPHIKYALAVFDIDKFKMMNDKSGHVFGDKVLKMFGQRLRAAAKPGETLGRIGGDEFILCFHYNDNPQERADRLFAAISGDYFGVAVMVSMGIATVETVGTDYEALFTAADTALYEIKRSGRNGYFVYDESLKTKQSSNKATRQIRDSHGDAPSSVIYTPNQFYDEIGGDYIRVIEKFHSKQKVMSEIMRFPQYDDFTNLSVAISNWSIYKATRALNTLMDTANELGFSELYTDCCNLGEDLRKNDREKAAISFARLENTYSRIIDALVLLRS